MKKKIYLCGPIMDEHLGRARAWRGKAKKLLGEHFALSGTSWLWIDDLARPDAIATLPVPLPFFGPDLNLLPFLMTALTLLAAARHRDPELTPALLRAQRRRLYLLAALFFALFYTFPAAMVLYWTMNNALHLLVAGARAARRR